MPNYFFNSVKDFVVNPRFVRNAVEYSSVLPNYLLTRRSSAEIRNSFDTVHTYAMFIGIGRSGTTLIGSLLDAHPKIIIANQETALKYMHPRLFSREQVYRLLLRNSEDCARSGRIGGGGYSYQVKDQWQGKFDRLEVIGDKSKSAQDVTWLTSKPSILDKMAEVTGARIRMMHVIRNPYDTIATRSVRRNLPLRKITREYFALCGKLQKLISRIEMEEAYDVQRIPLHLEDFIENPARYLADICNSLGVDAGSDYTGACARIVNRKPHKRRFEVEWNKGLIEEIKLKIEDISFLKRYSFDD